MRLRSGESEMDSGLLTMPQLYVQTLYNVNARVKTALNRF